jgi:hypothetical protein
MQRKKWQKDKTLIHKILHRKLKIEQHERQYKQGVNSGAHE